MFAAPLRPPPLPLLRSGLPRGRRENLYSHSIVPGGLEVTS